MIGTSRAQRKHSALRRAQFNLRVAHERIDYDFDVIKPELEEIKALEATQHVVIEIGEGELDADNKA